MGEQRTTPPGWLPPVAPGAPPRPRVEPPPTRGVEPPPFRPRAPSHSAVWALVLAITGLALLLVSLGTLFLFTLPCSIAGWVLALRARGQARAAAALWIARIGVIAGVMAAVIFFALLAGGFDFEQFRDDVERELRERRDRPSGGVRAWIQGLRAVAGR
jgi:hypothetical protein